MFEFEWLSKRKVYILKKTWLATEIVFIYNKILFTITVNCIDKPSLVIYCTTLHVGRFATFGGGVWMYDSNAIKAARMCWLCNFSSKVVAAALIWEAVGSDVWKCAQGQRPQKSRVVPCFLQSGFWLQGFKIKLDPVGLNQIKLEFIGSNWNNLDQSELK